MMGINFYVEMGGLGVFMLSGHCNIDVDRRKLGSCPCIGVKDGD